MLPPGGKLSSEARLMRGRPAVALNYGRSLCLRRRNDHVRKITGLRRPYFFRSVERNMEKKDRPRVYPWESPCRDGLRCGMAVV